MAATVLQQGIVRDGGMSLDRNYRSQDSVSMVYKTVFSEAVIDPVEAYVLSRDVVAVANKITPLPVEGSVYNISTAPHLFAQDYKTVAAHADHTVWHTTVYWKVAPRGQDSNHVTEENPLLRPVIYDVEYIEEEYAILEGKNVEALAHGNGTGGNRAAGTNGPIVVASGVASEIPLVDTERNAVLLITRNFPSFDNIVAFNETYRRTTNDAVFGNWDAKTLKYLVTDSNGLVTSYNSSGVESSYYTGTTRIGVKKTTQLVINNHSYSYWDGTRIVEKPNIAEPMNLKLDGTRATAGSTTITYEHLEPVSYNGLIAAWP